MVLLLSLFGLISAYGESLDHQLFTAAKHGDVASVELLLKQGANPNYFVPNPEDNVWAGVSPLWETIFLSQSTGCVKALLAAGADPLETYKPHSWLFGLEAACQDGMTNRQILEMVLADIKQIPLDRSSDIMEYVLYPLIRRNDLQTVERLRHLGADLGTISGGGKAVFMTAAEMGRYDQAEKWLVEFSEEYRHATNQVDVDWAVDQLGSDHFFDDENLAQLISHAKQLGIRFFDSRNQPIWSRAVAYRCPKTAEALGCPPEDLKKITTRTTEEQMLAASCNADSFPLFTNLVQKCLQESADRKIAASRYLQEILAQRFPLFSFNLNALKYLHQQGADVNYEATNNPEGLQTPLEAALLRNSVETMQWLVEEGADVNHINSGMKMSALEFAVILGRENMINWLLAHGAKIQENKTGRSLLVAALNGQNPDVLFNRLLKAGADPYFLHDQNQSAVDLMAKRIDITRLRKFDKEGIYRSLVHDFTPPTNSPFIGSWVNKGGWGTGIDLKKDGTGTFLTGGVGAMPIIWREHDGGAELYDKETKTRNRPAVPSTNQVPSCIPISFVGGKQKIRIGSNDMAVFEKVAVEKPKVHLTNNAAYFTTNSPMTIARSGHTATLLVDGKVLIVGGFDSRIQSTGNTSSSNLLNTELYDPIAKACAAAAPMITARAPQTIGCAPHSATLLMNTMVLIASANHDGNDSELYNPAGDSWKPAGQMVVPRTQHTATLLKDGTVMVVGGTDGTNQLADTELFVSGQSSWSRAASLTTARARHTATLLPNGKVLVVGGVRTLKQGVDKDFFDHAFHIGYLASAELYDPVSKSWTATGTLNYPRADHTATLLPDGKVLVTGGQTYGEYDRVIEIDSAEIYDPGTTEWTESASMNTARTGHTATLLPGGQVLVAGGWDRAALSSVELYNPKTDTWSVCRSLNQGRYGQTATLLQDGGVLIAGGLGNYRPEQFTPLASTELFHLSGNRNP